MRKHHYFIIVALGSIIVWFAVTEVRPTELYKPDNWATISVAIGAIILTLVGIITSILVSNENNRRAEFIENLTFISNNIEEKAGTNPDRSLSELYDNSVRELRALTDEMLPLKYSEGVIGILSFYFFLMSAIMAMYGYAYKFVEGSFTVGMILLIGYVIYIIGEFFKMDASTTLPKMKGELTLLTVRVNGENRHFEMRGKEAFVRGRGQRINAMEFKVKFVGKTRNGFLHAVVRYKNGRSSHIPDYNTYLSKFGFTDGYILTLSDRRLDTGILQTSEPIDLSIDVCREVDRNPFQENVEVEGLGRRKVYQYCSIPDGFHVNSIEIRMYEDPFHRSNYKRRAIDLVTVRPERIVT